MGRQSHARVPGAVGICVALGLWLILCPFILGFSANRVAKWNDIAAGVAVAVVAVGGASWWNVVIGIWLVVSSFVLGVAKAPALVWNNVILGGLVALMALAGAARGEPEYSPPKSSS